MVTFSHWAGNQSWSDLGLQKRRLGKLLGKAQAKPTEESEEGQGK